MGLSGMKDYTKQEQYDYLIKMLADRNWEYISCCSSLRRAFAEDGKSKKGIPDTDAIYRQAENALLLVDNARRQLADWLIANSDCVHVAEPPP